MIKYGIPARQAFRKGEKMSVRDVLQKELSEHKGQYISGRDIAEQAGCSRTAVWKAVLQLREEGYRIEAVRNRGYCLTEENDILSEGSIARYLCEEGYGSDVRVQVFQEISSTNDVLKRMAVTEHVPAGTALVSDYQTGGKGRLGRHFFSPKGSGLYLSILLRPEGPVQDNLILTAHAATAVYRAVRKVTGIELEIKWVNDLYHHGRKVCGILSEGQASMESGRLDFIIVGIGINLYEPEGGFPEEIREIAGTVCERPADGSVDRNRLAAAVIAEFLRLSGEKQLAQEYIDRNLVPGKDIMVIDGKRTRPAKALRILPDGRLEIEEADGERTELVFGEISVRLRKDT